MASIDKRPNGRWRARYRERPGGPQRARHFDRKADAERFLARIQGQLLDGSYIDPDAGQTTLAEYAAVWQRSQLHRPTTVMQVDAHLRNHVLPFFGDRPIATIRPREVQAWVRSRTEVLAPATGEVVYRTFAAILNTAVDDRLITRSPASGVRLPRRTRHEIQPPTVEQVEALLDAMPDRYKALVVVAAGTGLRQGECFGLTVDRVDFLRRLITVDRQLILSGSSPPEFGPPKTAASVRTVPLPKVVGESLAAHLERWPVDANGLNLYKRARWPTPPQSLRRNLACRRRTCRSQRPPLSRPPPLLRLSPHPPRRVRQGRPSPPRPRLRLRDPRHLLSPLARQRGTHPSGR